MRVQLSHGERIRLKEVFTDHYRDVHRFLRGKGFCEEESRDLVQDTFWSASRGFRGYRGEASFKTWLLTIARNLSTNRIRDNRAEKRGAPEIALDAQPDGGDWLLELSSAGAAADDPLFLALQRERQRRLREAILELSPRMRACLMLHIYQGRKYQDIAELLGISINTVKSQIFQAKANLRGKLEDLFPNDAALSEGEQA